MLLRHLFGLLMAVAAALAATSSEPYPITGVYVDPRAGSVPLRKNINDFAAERGAQWDLYILSIAALQAEPFENQLSYFQVGGVHGKPYIEWNGAGGKTSDGWLGYCPHGEKLFLSWHRPYMLLYEVGDFMPTANTAMADTQKQVLVQKAKDIAQTFPQRYRFDYAKAAETLRAPFWDWAADSRVPPATVPKTVRVKVPNGQALEEKDIPNPLAVYRFPREVLDGKYGTFDPDNRSEILRCPDSEGYPNHANRLMAGRPYKRWTYDVFTHAQTFEDFASTGDGGISLEQIHNGVHWDAACGGQFLSSDLTAFDPLFMLHHANVDRLWAYWQAISPQQSIFQTSYPGGARFSSPKGTSIGPDSPLHPFFKAKGQLHTTRSVEKIQNFGYSYVGLEWWTKSPEQMKQDAKALINRVYGQGASTAKLKDRDENGETRYFVSLSVDVTEVERPCTVNVYVAGEEVGSMVLMEQPTEGTIHGGFPLDSAIEESGMSNLGVVTTLESIKSTLKVAIIKRDGEQIALDSVPSLKFEIENVFVEPPEEEDELPAFGSSARQPAVAEEKEDAILVM